ncbi:hypothetical protein BDP55DRAFT_628476 [Colletotrichum godetiae]|uniref:Uncharacterized protein n=1 Tax=Colletotrichum godetiae TaxID=1209918 RepID=A0AAJ0AVV8_9PEZI|nr:uncharacterized protein BDP55DRAFT_628476 [Colletotrichum godetiae]KAK1689941.1 hypothetical protein BDP55DRAFT_628476 [Colletotrichum godetiae]
MLALESIQMDENSIDASGTSEPGALNTTLAPAPVTGLCYQNILRPRQILCYELQTSGFGWAVDCGLWSVGSDETRTDIPSLLLTCLWHRRPFDGISWPGLLYSCLTIHTDFAPFLRGDSTCICAVRSCAFPHEVCIVIEDLAGASVASQRLFWRAGPGLRIKRWSKLSGLAITPRL